MAKKTDVFELSGTKSYDESGNLRAGVEEIDISFIDANPEQPRKNFDADALEELANSIKQHGIIQPIILSPEGGRFSVVAVGQAPHAGQPPPHT